MFLTGYGSSFLLSTCALTRLFRGHYVLNSSVLPGLLASWSFMCERSSRRPELAVFMINQALYALWQYYLARSGLALPYGSTLVFAVSLSTLVYAAQFHPRCLRGLAGGLVSANLHATSEATPRYSLDHSEQLSGRVRGAYATALSLVHKAIAALSPTPAVFQALCGFFRGLVFGWGARTLLNVASVVLRGRFKELPRAFLRENSLRLGVVVGLMRGIFHGLSCALSSATMPVSRLRTVLAALLAGLASALGRAFWHDRLYAPKH